MVQPYSSTDMVTASKISHFTLSEVSDFRMVVNLSIAVPASPMRILTSISVDIATYEYELVDKF